jgi:phage gp46-like protein
MAFDLAISEHGDLIMTAHRDLAGISGSGLVEQRMRIRMMLHRGEWIFDSTASLGSQLHTLSGMPSDQASRYASAYVREALKDMEEISVEDVQVITTSHDITLVVHYQTQLTEDGSIIPADNNLQQLFVTVPVVAANE